MMPSAPLPSLLVSLFEPTLCCSSDTKPSNRMVTSLNSVASEPLPGGPVVRIVFEGMLGNPAPVDSWNTSSVSRMDEAPDSFTRIPESPSSASVCCPLATDPDSVITVTPFTSRSTSSIDCAGAGCFGGRDGCCRCCPRSSSSLSTSSSSSSPSCRLSTSS
uniref:Putative secreted protein n=1 Tax=Anopheles marajoara TaxID=58244 RepID=A0A2M4C664_9DIPT